MDFFDKIGSLARSVSGKTGDMLEVGKLNAQIHIHEDDIEELKIKLGEHFWNKYQSGVIMDEQAAAICQSIRSAYEKISSCRAEISGIRRAQEENRIQREAEAPPAVLPSSPAIAFCPECGEPAAPRSRFCGGCGARLY